MNEERKFQKKQRSLLRMYLYRYRQNAGLSIYKVTDLMLLSKPYYYQIEQGIKGHRMDVVMLNDLAIILGIDFETICKDELLYQKERRSLGLRYEARWVVEDEL